MPSQGLLAEATAPAQVLHICAYRGQRQRGSPMGTRTKVEGKGSVSDKSDNGNVG